MSDDSQERGLVPVPRQEDAGNAWVRPRAPVSPAKQLDRAIGQATRWLVRMAILLGGLCLGVMFLLWGATSDEHNADLGVIAGLAFLLVAGLAWRWPRIKEDRAARSEAERAEIRRRRKAEKAAYKAWKKEHRNLNRAGTFVAVVVGLLLGSWLGGP